MSATSTTIVLSDETKIHARLLGDENKHKPLLVALHGAPGLSSHLEPLEAYGFLADKYQFLVYDARGSGKSDCVGPFTDDQWISDLEEIRVWAGAKTFVLAGGSYGGFLALGYALSHPQRLSGLILRDTWACGFRGTLRVLKNIVTSTRIRPDFDRQVRVWSGNVRDSDEGAKALAEILPIYTPEKGASEGDEAAEFEGAGCDFEMRWGVHNAAWSCCVPRFDVRHRLHEVKVPTLVMVGRHDPVCPTEDSEEIHHGILGSELSIFESSGHNPSADEPVAFKETVGNFLAKLIEPNSA